MQQVEGYTYVEGGVCAALGFTANGCNCGLNPDPNKNDLGMIYSEKPCHTAAVYTTNKVKGAPILVTKKHLAQTGHIAQAVIINSKNALSILDNFLLSVSNNVLTITGSDQENTITATVDVTEQEGEGRVAVNAKRLLDTLKELPGQPLEISVNDETFEVDIRFLNGHFVFMGVNGNEYPELGNYEGDAARLHIKNDNKNEVCDDIKNACHK